MCLAMILPPAGLARAEDLRLSGFGIEFAGGPVWQAKNNVEIPNDGTATRFSIADLVGRGPYAAFRAYITYDFAEKHGLRLLIAPLTIEGTGIPAESIRFEHKTFAAGVPADASYRFDSYRLTYRYRFYRGDRWRWHIGFTGKIRDAEVKLSQGNLSASNSNIGFVPLLHLHGTWDITGRLRAVFDADALAAPQGRAEDVAVKLAYRLTGRCASAIGYRLVEGGADVEKVYTFAWLHYLEFSFGCSF